MLHHVTINVVFSQRLPEVDRNLHFSVFILLIINCNVYVTYFTLDPKHVNMV